MNAMRWICGLALVMCLTPGCDVQPPEPHTAPAPATNTEQPAEQAPAAPQTDPQTQVRTAPALSFMMIDGQLFEFPKARLRVYHRDGETTALLFSDDPRQNVGETYTGNSYYLEMRLAAEQPADYHQEVWQHRASTSERIETPNGIFLDGWTRHLQPFDLSVEFEPHENSSLTTVWLAGHFLLFHTRERQMPGQLVPVSGRLMVEPEIK
jgi:hypothetical protein